MGTLAALLLALCTSFSPIKDALPRQQQTTVAARSEYYYWYSFPANDYEGYMPTSVEITDLEEEYQVDIDTNPSGGTLIANGYVLYGLPHTIWPSVNLFAHY